MLSWLESQIFSTIVVILRFIELMLLLSAGFTTLPSCRSDPELKSSRLGALLARAFFEGLHLSIMPLISDASEVLNRPPIIWLRGRKSIRRVSLALRYIKKYLTRNFFLFFRLSYSSTIVPGYF
jgi:hypothetical protein